MLLKPSSITNARDDDDAEGDLQDQTYILGATIETRNLLTSLRDMLAGTSAPSSVAITASSQERLFSQTWGC